MNYSKEDIEYSLKKALDELLIKDNDIIEIDINERTISHRLAIYLECHFPEWNVDVEYNRNHEDIKIIEDGKKLKKILNIDPNDTNGTTVYPDIIVHKRKTNENLLVIEMKKSTSGDDGSFDKIKLEGFKKELKYDFAVFLKIYIKGGEKPYDYAFI
jgi:hypothetical protein